MYAPRRPALIAGDLNLRHFLAGDIAALIEKRASAMSFRTHARRQGRLTQYSGIHDQSTGPWSQGR